MEQEPLTLTEIRIVNPVTVDLGSLADIPVIVENTVGLSPLSTIVPRKKRKLNIVNTVRKSKRLLEKNK